MLMHMIIITNCSQYVNNEQKSYRKTVNLTSRLKKKLCRFTKSTIITQCLIVDSYDILQENITVFRTG